MDTVVDPYLAAAYAAAHDAAQAAVEAAYRGRGVTSKLVDTVLPSGRRGFRAEWYINGVHHPGGVNGMVMDGLLRETL